jgi:hypothetical protein
MRVVLLTHCSPEYQSLGDITLPRWEKYCAKWGYDFDVSRTQSSPDLPWEKMRRIASFLQQYDLVQWVGVDTYCTNLNQNAVGWWHANDQPAALLTWDLYGINADSMIFSNCPWAHMFLYAINTLGKNFYHSHPFLEQEALSRFAFQKPYCDVVKIIPQKGMNSYLHKVYGRPEEWPGNWEPGDWILHLPGMTVELRIQILGEIEKILGKLNTAGCSTKGQIQPVPGDS